MRHSSVWIILLAALVSAAVAAVIVGLTFPPPDASAAALGLAWLGGPFLLAVALAALLRRRPGALTSMLATVILAGAVGAACYGWVAYQVAEARHAAATAVLPGENPNSGAAGMRKTGADAGQFITELLGVVALVIVPPAQALTFALAGGIGYAASTRRRD